MYYRKYRNKKVERNGIVFDSKLEADFYDQLLQLEKEGLVSNIRRQVIFELIPAQREPDTIGPKGGIIKGKTIERSCSYVADFVYTNNVNKEEVVIDTKGFHTADYLIKRKLMLYLKGIRICEISRTRKKKKKTKEK